MEIALTSILCIAIIYCLIEISSIGLSSFRKEMRLKVATIK